MSRGGAGSFDAVVLGGGAAGLFCAATAGARGRRVLVLEANERPGKKILVSGGGRANFTNRHVGAEHYVSANPHFARSALARYRPEAFLALVESAGIPWHEREHGQLFCNDSAKAITNLLLRRCAMTGVRIETGLRVEQGDVERLPGGDATAPRFLVRTERLVAATRALVLATGGLSWPRLGVSDLSHRVAHRFGLALVPPRPGLVPLLWNAADAARFGPLAGIAVPARVSCGPARFEEAVLFTHGGLSGPAILQVSNHWRPSATVSIDWLPGRDLAAEWLAARAAGENRSAQRSLAEALPRRLAEALLDSPAALRPLAQVSDADLSPLAARVQAFAFQPAGDAGWDKAEVTLGGVDTAGLSSRSMEAREVPGLFVIGEAVDVTGWLGGYNFQWAWASAHAAGEAL